MAGYFITDFYIFTYHAFFYRFFPQFIRTNLIRPYSLKALPCFIVWLVLVFQLLTKDFSQLPQGDNT